MPHWIKNNHEDKKYARSIFINRNSSAYTEDSCMVISSAADKNSLSEISQATTRGLPCTLTRQWRKFPSHHEKHTIKDGK